MKKLIASLLTVSLLFSGCGTPSEDASTNTETTPQPTAVATEQPTESASTAGETRTVTTYLGDVEVPNEPKRVALIANFLDYTVAFEQDVVGALSASNTYGTDVPPYLQSGVNEGITFFQFTNDPDLEALMAVEPDLIIGYKREGNEKVYDQLSMIAPTVLMEHEWGNIDQALEEFGRVLGKEEKAVEIEEMYHAKADEYATQIHTVVGEDEDIMFLRIREKDYRVYGPTGQTKRVLNDDLKLKPLEGFPEGEKWLDVSMEGIFAFNPDHIIIDVDSGDSAAAMMTQLEQSEVWKSLDAVKNGNVYVINDFLDSTLGPIGSLQAMEDLANQMTAE